jgi:electron transfer flavoprotein alpha subunit
VANLLVYIELKDKEARQASLCALNAGRAIATGLGGTLYALLPCNAPPSYGNDDIIAVLSRHGADKVILVTGPDLDEVPLHATHGEAVRVACVQFRPRLVLLASTAAGRDIAPRLAMQLGARYVPDVELQQSGEDFQLSGVTFRRRTAVSESLRGTSAPVVATLLTHGAPRTLGDDEAEVVMLQSPSREPGWPKVVGRRRAPERDPLAARLVVAGGAGLATPDSFSRLQKLADALGAAAVASPSACAKQPDSAGLRPPGCVGADTYLAFGVSGSERHLASLPPWTRVIAVNTDAGAPILQIADQALIADADQTVKELLAELEGPDGQEGA